MLLNIIYYICINKEMEIIKFFNRMQNTKVKKLHWIINN